MICVYMFLYHWKWLLNTTYFNFILQFFFFLKHFIISSFLDLRWNSEHYRIFFWVSVVAIILDVIAAGFYIGSFGSGMELQSLGIASIVFTCVSKIAMFVIIIHFTYTARNEEKANDTARNKGKGNDIELDNKNK